jgi:adenylate cyclase
MPAGSSWGVLYVESPDELRFTYEDEDAMVAVAAHVGLATLALREDDAEASESPAVATHRSATEPSSTSAPVLQMRHFLADDSIFLGDDYLIKGVAGAILAKLVREYQETRRTAFTNRELRLDAALKLPDYSDNLEARLVLLQRRLAERSPHLQIEKSSRGRFRLQIDRPVALEEVAGR